MLIFGSMNMDQLHINCKSATREAYYWFKHSIKNPLFPVNHNYIQQNIYHMHVAMGQKIVKRFYDSCDPSAAQLNILLKTVDDYKRIAEQCAWKFGYKHASKSD